MKSVPPLLTFRASAGWTVVEVLIGLTALAVIIMVSAPGINSLSQAYYLKKTSSNLLTSLTQAQDEATRRGSITRLCPSSDGKSCRPDGDWNRGWVVFVDINANHEPDPVEVIDVYGPPRGKVHIDASGSLSSNAEFRLDGRLNSDVHPSAGRFRICHGDGSPGFQEILFNVSGRPEVRESDQECNPS